jgi:hypothetical protein
VRRVDAAFVERDLFRVEVESDDVDLFRERDRDRHADVPQAGQRQFRFPVHQLFVKVVRHIVIGPILFVSASGPAAIRACADPPPVRPRSGSGDPEVKTRLCFFYNVSLFPFFSSPDRQISFIGAGMPRKPGGRRPGQRDSALFSGAGLTSAQILL